MIVENLLLARELSVLLDRLGLKRYRISFDEYKAETSRNEWVLKRQVSLEVPTEAMWVVVGALTEKYEKGTPARIHVEPLPLLACRIEPRQVVWGSRFRRAMLAMQAQPA